MIGLELGASDKALTMLCFGAHSDDIEIGLGATILSLLSTGRHVNLHWCVCSANGIRADEAEASAAEFLDGAANYQLSFGNFEDSYFPVQSKAIKHWMNEIARHVSPDIIFTHTRDDAHQDHREINLLTWNVFRDHMILEYEIPKWDGDLGRPNVYVPIDRAVMERKVDLLATHFGTQRCKDWFDREIFRGLARMRGMECRAPDRYAEAFFMRKARLAI